jgi:protein-tyrosine-phosphatase
LEIDGDNQKKAMINLIASFMRNSCRSWNNENLTEEAICEHISILSAGKLAVLPEDITILYQTRDSNRNQNANFQNNRNKNFKDNRNRRNGGKPKNNFRNK